MSLVHGMGVRPVARDGPALTVEGLAPVMEVFPELGGVLAVEWRSPRPFASGAIVRCGVGRVFVKRHDRRVRDVAGLVEEHAFIAHSRARGVAVPAVCVGASGTTAVDVAGTVWEVHALGEGEDRYREALSWTVVRDGDARAVGRALAALHCAAEGFAAPARGARLLVGGDWVLRAGDRLDALAGWAAESDALGRRPWREDARRWLLPWYAALGEYSEEMLWAHGDFHVSNLLWREGGVSDVLDFGLCNRASAAWDLATAIERNTIAWLELSGGRRDIGRADLAEALLAGYAERRAVPKSVARVLPVVHVEFALSELEYFCAVTGSLVNEEAAYTDFLLGHAAWFAGAEGRAFLAAVGACC